MSPKKQISLIQCCNLYLMTSIMQMIGNQKYLQNRLWCLSSIQKQLDSMTALEWILIRRTIFGCWIHKLLCMPAVSVTISTILFRAPIKYSLVGMAVELVVLQFIRVVNTIQLLKKVHSLMCTFMIYNINFIEFYKKEQNDHTLILGSQKMEISLLL